MKKQTKPNLILATELPGSGADHLCQDLWPALYTEVTFSEGLEEAVSAVFLSSEPGMPRSPEIDPEEFESVYLWFLS